MKKFTQLSIGETFEFQGKHFIKAGPLTARDVGSGKQRIIPRSAMVTPGESTAPVPRIQTDRQLPAEQVIEAFEQYHKGCLERLLVTEESDSELTSRIREAMETARQRFLTELQQLAS